MAENRHLTAAMLYLRHLGRNVWQTKFTRRRNRRSRPRPCRRRGPSSLGLHQVRCRPGAS